MKIVGLPDGREAEFPDSMSNEAISAVLAKQFAPDVRDRPALPRGGPGLEGPDATTGLTPIAQAYRTGQPNAHKVIGQAPGWIEQGVGGAKHAWDRAAMGVKGMFTDLSPEDRQLLEQGAQFVKQTGPASTVGQVAGDVAITAPAFALGGAAVGLPRAVAALSRLRSAAPAVATVAPIAADVAVNAGLAAALSPEDRGSAALWGAGGATAGRMANRVVSGLVRPTEEAAALMRNGVRLTPGQAGAGGMGAAARFSEQAAEGLPFIGSAVSSAKKQSLEDWNRLLLAQAEAKTGVPGAARTVASDAAIGRPGLKEVGEDFTKQYGNIFPKNVTFKFDDALKSSYDDLTSRLVADLPPSTQGTFESVASWVDKQLTRGIPASQWKETIQGEVAGAVKEAKRKGQNSLVVALRQLDNHLERAVPKFSGSPVAEAGDLLQQLDRGYFDYNTLKTASEKAAAVKRGGTIYPAELAVTASKKGNENLQNAGVEAQKVFGNAPNVLTNAVNMVKAAGTIAAGQLGGPLVGIPPAAMAILSTFPQGRKALLGQYPIQKLLEENPQLAMQIGRAMATQGQ